ncbi:MAG: T9SS type A sorting domain-containing protein [Chitinophagales bacterium]|nr:T9SS type A sorting domain-containing protein [Chitinophagales bacterium]
MKKVLPIFLLCAGIATCACGQITITSGDMPVSGDTLRYSTTIPVGFNINLNDTGANKVWNFDTMKPVTQGLNEYKLALQVNLAYVTISPTAYGYKVADTFGGAGGAPLPISVTEVYTFFNKKGTAPNNRFIAEGFGAKISGVPIPATYSNEDELFFFPLEYGDKDTSDYYLNVPVPSVGRMVQTGDRRTQVDAWGTIQTPYFTTPKSCIRVRSEVSGTDSFIMSSLPVPPIGIPRQTVDYFWLVQGEHYPALWITTNMVGSTETISTVRYRDTYRGLSVGDVKTNTISKLDVYPNPADNRLRIDIPAGNTHFIVEVFDLQGKLVLSAQDNNDLDITRLTPGNYFTRVTFENGIGVAPFVKQ